MPHPSLAWGAGWMSCSDLTAQSGHSWSGQRGQQKNECVQLGHVVGRHERGYGAQNLRKAAESALWTARRIVNALEEKWLQVSGTKTGSVTSSKQACSWLRDLRRLEDPEVRDLGIDSTGGKRRRIVTAARQQNAQARAKRLKVLGPPADTRIRVYKAAISSVTLWGHPSTGAHQLRRATLFPSTPARWADGKVCGKKIEGTV